MMIQGFLNSFVQTASFIEQYWKAGMVVMTNQQGQNNNNYKTGKHIKGRKCACGKILSTGGADKCKSCAAKLAGFQKGKKHPNFIDGKSHTKEYRRKYSKQYRNSTIQRKLRDNIGGLIRLYLRKRKVPKKSKLLEILPYSLQELKEHLENQFKPGMTWDNMGKWQIDHRIPDSKFNYKSVKDLQFKQSWSLKNLQPLWENENKRKSNKLIY